MDESLVGCLDRKRIQLRLDPIKKEKKFAQPLSFLHLYQLSLSLVKNKNSLTLDYTIQFSRWLVNFVGHPKSDRSFKHHELLFEQYSSASRESLVVRINFIILKARSAPDGHNILALVVYARAVISIRQIGHVPKL